MKKSLSRRKALSVKYKYANPYKITKELYPIYSELSARNVSPTRFFADLVELKLPFELEILIPDDDPVCLLSTFMELELTDLYRSYGKIKSNQATPCQLFKIAVFVEECELSYGIQFIFNGKKFGLWTLKKSA